MKISNKIKTVAAGSASVIAAGLNAGAANAAVVYCPDGKASTTGDLSGCTTGNKGVNASQNKNDLMSTLTTIINVIIGVIGFVAVIVIILGGVQYTTSAGDPGKVKKAKDTILYGIIGLVVALLAFAIVNFVLTAVMGK
ncbi:MAG: pilin [Candidatus Saccharibacteria bacterium]|nr:pilin [Candidatus Saccharibacteria bacterium]